MVSVLHFPPQALTEEHARPPLAAAFDAALARPLIMVISPAGTGKTVAARALWHRWNGHKAWLTFSPWEMESSIWQSRLIGAAGEAWGLAIDDLHGPGLAPLLSRLGQASGLLILDDVYVASPACWGTLGQIAAALPPSAHLLVLSRNLPPLPLSLWRTQGRLAVLEHADLRLKSDEWAERQLGGDCADWWGWWGARLAASDDQLWDAPLAEWLDTAFFASLPAVDLERLGLAALLPRLTAADYARLSGQAAPLAQAEFGELARLPAPIQHEGDTLAVLPRFRPYVLQAWRRAAPTRWAEAATRGIANLLADDAAEMAARLAWDAGLPEQQREVLEKAGWLLFFRADRGLLADLLALQGPEASATVKLLRLLWLIECDKVPHRAEPQLHALQATLTGENRAIGQMLEALISWHYDDVERAGQIAEEAIKLFRNDRHPARHLAEFTLAGSDLTHGRLAAADERLRGVLARASRDRLPRLQVDVLQRQALLRHESGDWHSATPLIAEARRLAEQGGLTRNENLDSLDRLQAMLQLEQLDLVACEATLAAGSACCSEPWHFPHQMFTALRALLQGDLASAEAPLAAMEKRLQESFLCRKWRNEALLVRVLYRSLKHDRAGLLALADEPAADWPDSLYRWRRELWQHAARVLAQSPLDRPAVDALRQRLAAAGYQLLAHWAQLLLALDADEAAGRPGLLEAIRWAAARQSRLPLVCLAPRAIGRLEALAQAPELSHDASTLTFLRELLQRLLQPAAPASAASTDSPPPAGLTQQEWRILQLIGQQYTNEQIAAKLFVSLATVKTHINHLYNKLDIKTRAEAIHRARTLS